MSADRSAASDGGPVVSHTRRPVGNRVPRRVPSLCFDMCATALETRPLPAISRAHPPVTSTDYPAAYNEGGRRFPGPPSGADRPLHSPCSPLAVLWRFGHAAAHYVDRSTGLPHRPGTTSGTGQRSPPALRTHTGDPTPIMPVKGRYYGEIESLDRDPGTVTLDPGMQFPGD